MRPEHPIALELRLAEELIGRALVREQLVALEVLVDVARLVAVAGGFDVNQHTVRRGGAIDLRIANATHRRMAAAHVLGAFLIAPMNGDLAELDRDPEVDANLAHRVAEIRE